MREVDFTEANLQSAQFSESDLTGTLFSNTNLEKANFKGATNLSIDPDHNKMKGAQFHSFQLEGLLYKHGLEVE